MHLTTRIALVAACVLAGGASHAADPLNNNPPNPRPPGMQAPSAPVGTISPVFHQLVVFTMPAHFMPVFEKTNGSFYIREHIPQGETVDHWTRMITLTGMKDLVSNPQISARALVERIAAGFRRNCPDSYATTALGPQSVDGNDGFAVVASCGRVLSGSDTHSETAVMLAFRGSADYYTIQWAERGVGLAQPLTLDTAYWAKRLTQLAPIRLCPLVPGEPPPYVSCVGQ